MRIPALALLAALAVPSLEEVTADQPPVSVVMDGRGFVYYSDLQNVWRISPDGARTIAVIGVHTHQLYVDAENRLYGEDATIDEATGRPYHRVWRLDPDGTLTDVIPRRAGSLWDYGDFGFVRDRMGVAYVLQHSGGPALVRIGATGRVTRTTLPRAEPGFALPMDDRVVITAGRDLLRADPRRQNAMVWKENLAGLTPRVVEVEDRHALLGLWRDPQGQIYVAAYAGAAVIRIGTDGETSIVARSPDGWAPSGGMVGPDDSLWLLEMSSAGQVRVRRVMSDGTEQVY
jgi:sugar lactone lactonase YvrE